MSIRGVIGALALAGALWGCGDGGSPATRDGTGGAVAETGGSSGLGGGPGTGPGTGGAATGGTPASGGEIGTGGAGKGGALGTGGGGPAGVPGSGGAVTARGGAGGAATGGAAGGGAPPSCESLGWHPGSASLCGASKGGYDCAACGDASGTLPAGVSECISAVALQGGTVLCANCVSCR